MKQEKIQYVTHGNNNKKKKEKKAVKIVKQAKNTTSESIYAHEQKILSTLQQMSINKQ
jgi:hypothetical protein